MASLQSKKYTVGEMSLVVDNMDKKFEGLERNVNEKFSSMNENILLLTKTINDFKEYKAEVGGTIRATIFWISSVFACIVALVTYSFNVTQSERDAKMINIINDKIKISEQSTKTYVDSKEFQITK